MGGHCTVVLERQKGLFKHLSSSIAVHIRVSRVHIRVAACTAPDPRHWRATNLGNRKIIKFVCGNSSKEIYSKILFGHFCVLK